MKNNAIAQRARLLKRLQEKPCTTMDARHELDIVSPAPRVFELRHVYGYNIQTHWSTEYNPGGSKHRVAKYVLLPGHWEGASNET